MKEDYLQALAAIQTKVSEEHTSSLSQLKEWMENDFTSPTDEYIKKDAIASSLLKKTKKICKGIARGVENRPLK